MPPVKAPTPPALAAAAAVGLGLGLGYIIGHDAATKELTSGYGEDTESAVLYVDGQLVGWE